MCSNGGLLLFFCFGVFVVAVWSSIGFLGQPFQIQNVVKEKSNSRAFTLVELLTVIAVIGILAAILIPAVSSIRLKSVDTKGESNIRQVGLAYLLAAQDNKGVLPSIYGATNSETWSRQVNSILLQAEAEDYPGGWSKSLLDPSAIARDVIAEDNRAKYHFAPLGAITRGNGNKGKGAAPKALRSYNRLIQHNHPQRQILLADAGVSSPEESPWGDILHGESFSWSGAWSGKIDQGEANEPIDPGENVGGDIRWMDGKAKFFFLDGHVERLAQDEVHQENLNPLFD